jgi:hypothetical protein
VNRKLADNPDQVIEALAQECRNRQLIPALSHFARSAFDLLISGGGWHWVALKLSLYSGGSGAGLRGSVWCFEAAELEHGGEAPDLGAGDGAWVIGQAGLPGAWREQRAVLHMA